MRQHQLGVSLLGQGSSQSGGTGLKVLSESVMAFCVTGLDDDDPCEYRYWLSVLNIQRETKFYIFHP